MKKDCGYQELEHTADWAIKVWAPDLESLLVTAAKSMYTLSRTETDISQLIDKEFSLEYLDPESLLVDFLSELIFLAEIKQLAAINYDLKIIGNTITTNIQTAKIISRQKEIKAITYHQLEVVHKDSGVETIIIFDV